MRFDSSGVNRAQVIPKFTVMSCVGAAAHLPSSLRQGCCIARRVLRMIEPASAFPRADVNERAQRAVAEWGEHVTTLSVQQAPGRTLQYGIGR